MRLLRSVSYGRIVFTRDALAAVRPASHRLRCGGQWTTTGQPGPMLMANRWSQHPGKRHLTGPAQISATRPDVLRYVAIVARDALHHNAYLDWPAFPPP